MTRAIPHNPPTAATRALHSTIKAQPGPAGPGLIPTNLRSQGMPTNVRPRDLGIMPWMGSGRYEIDNLSWAAQPVWTGDGHA